MKITSIRQQVNKTDRYSIYVDGTYSFSLSEAALLTSGITKNQEISKEQHEALQNQADIDKLYGKALRYVSLRIRSEWEIGQYLKRKQASPPLVDIILNKLRDNNLIDDTAYAKTLVRDRLLLRPTSRRKIQFELQRKHINSEIIAKTFEDIEQTDQSTLLYLIERKRQQSRYADDMKLMQYLSRQGYNYGDIKEALVQYKAMQ